MIDTGARFTHQDLAPTIVGRYNRCGPARRALCVTGWPAGGADQWVQPCADAVPRTPPTRAALHHPRAHCAGTLSPTARCPPPAAPRTWMCRTSAGTARTPPAPRPRRATTARCPPAWPLAPRCTSAAPPTRAGSARRPRSTATRGAARPPACASSPPRTVGLPSAGPPSARVCARLAAPLHACRARWARTPTAPPPACAVAPWPHAGGYYGGSQAERQAIADLGAAGILFVAAAGNGALPPLLRGGLQHALLPACALLPASAARCAPCAPCRRARGSRRSLPGLSGALLSRLRPSPRHNRGGERRQGAVIPRLLHAAKRRLGRGLHQRRRPLLLL